MTTTHPTAPATRHPARHPAADAHDEADDHAHAHADAHAAEPRAGTACVCPECGAAATYDLAPNPGGPDGGEHAPPFPPELGGPPPDAIPGPEFGPWYLVVCSTNMHRFLCPQSRLDMLVAPPPGRRGVLPTVGGLADVMQGAAGPDRTRPATPREPGKPGTPHEPDQPGTPHEPGKPGTPHEPGKPGTPHEPAKPGHEKK